jgi:hypothetical protein
LESRLTVGKPTSLRISSTLARAGFIVLMTHPH